jgi:hypothetical protein
MKTRERANREIFYIIVIVVLIIVIASMLLQSAITTGSQQQALEKLKDVYELITEADVEVLSVEEASGVYRVMLMLRGNLGEQVEEVYVTKDGNLITDTVIDTEGYRTRLESEKAFIECMQGKRLLVFGQSNEPNTIQQLQILGNFAYKIYIDCVGANLQACQQLGIEQIPTVIYEGRNYTGIMPINWFESLTGCKL